MITTRSIIYFSAIINKGLLKQLQLVSIEGPACITKEISLRYDVTAASQRDPLGGAGRGEG